MALQRFRAPVRILKKCSFRLFCMALAAFILMQTAHAAPPAVGSSCDPNYMNALEARAYLEAQREIAQNQNLILKPDSVLDYSCFAQNLGIVENVDNGLFSNQNPSSTYPGLQNVIANVVGGALTSYQVANFGNSSDKNGPIYLGGRFLGNTSGIHDPRDQAAQSYACDQMVLVWNQARCMNFFDNSKTSPSGGPSAVTTPANSNAPTFTDGFFDFPWYLANDPRNPILNLSENDKACASPVSQNDLDTAFNSPTSPDTDNTNLYTISPAPGNTFPTGQTTAYTPDPIVTHLDQILPRGPGSTGGNCAKPIPTGICVVRSGSSYTYADGVCPNPGCHYVMPSHGSATCPDDPSTNVMGICVDANGQNASGLSN